METEIEMAELDNGTSKLEPSSPDSFKFYPKSKSFPNYSFAPSPEFIAIEGKKKADLLQEVIGIKSGIGIGGNINATEPTLEIMGSDDSDAIYENVGHQYNQTTCNIGCVSP